MRSRRALLMITTAAPAVSPATAHQDLRTTGGILPAEQRQVSLGRCLSPTGCCLLFFLFYCPVLCCCCLQNLAIIMEDARLLHEQHINNIPHPVGSFYFFYRKYILALDSGNSCNNRRHKYITKTADGFSLRFFVDVRPGRHRRR